MRVLVTGAAGYIGSVLVRELLESGAHVTAVDNFRYGQTGLLGSICPRLSVARADVRDDYVMSRLIATADVIIPLAAIVGAPACDQDQWAARETNYGAIRKMLAYRSRSQLIVSPCTNSGYGVNTESVCTEDSPINPLSLYAKTKVDAERAILDSGNSISLRLATVFGVSPRMRLDLLVNDLVYRAATERCAVIFEGHFMRNYAGLPDVCRAFMLALSGRLDAGAYNVGLDAANMSKLELCERIRRHVPGFTFVEAEVGCDPDQRNYTVSSAKIASHGFIAQYSLDQGITDLLKAYQILRRNAYTNI